MRRRIARIPAVDERGILRADHGHAVLAPVEGVRLPCRNKHATAVRFIHSDIAPPVHPCRRIHPVLDVHVDKQHVAGKGRLDTVRHATLSLVFVHHKDRFSLFVPALGGKHRTACIRMVPDDADIPFNTAGEPGVAQCQIGGLVYGVFIEQLPVFRFGIEGPEPSAQIEHKRCAEIFVFKDRHIHIALFNISVVLVEYGIGKDRVNRAAINPLALFFAESVRDRHLWILFFLIERLNRRNHVCFSHPCRVKCLFFECQRHNCLLHLCAYTQRIIGYYSTKSTALSREKRSCATDFLTCSDLQILHIFFTNPD